MYSPSRRPVLASLLVFCFLPLAPRALARQTAVASQGNAQVREMQQVEDSWDMAIAKRDQYALENILAPQLIDVAATGEVTTRDQDVAKIYAKDALPASMTQKIVDVRDIGDGVRVVTGTYTMHWLAAPGAPTGTPAYFDEKGVFTQVFQQVNGRWRCVNDQRTVVAEQMPAAKAKTTAPRAKSNATEPFHIPLIYKGAQSTQPAPQPGTNLPPPN